VASSEPPSGVTGPIEDPLLKEHNREYGEKVITVLQRDQKAFFKPFTMISVTGYYLFAKPAAMWNSIVEAVAPTKKPARFYHQKFNRVPNIWECDRNDPVCIFEAEDQFHRDKVVEQEIIRILQERLTKCQIQNKNIADSKCNELFELVESASNAYHIKYGELGVKLNARTCLNKQKNRFIEGRYVERVLKREVVE